MKKIASLLTILLLPILAQAKTYYLPFDQIRFPELDSHWNVQFGAGNELIRFELKDEARKPGQFRSEVVFSARPLHAFEQKSSNWKQSEKKNLPNGSKTIGNTFDAASGYGEWRYMTSVNLMPVWGSRLSRQSGSKLYSLDCRSEDLEQDKLSAWCINIFKKIQWSDSVSIAADSKKQTLNAFAKSVDYDSQILQDNLQNLMKQFSPNFTDYKKYAYLLIIQSLASDNGPVASSQQIDSLVTILRKDTKPEEPLDDWLLMSLIAQTGKFNEKSAEKLLSQTDKPPYWLVGAWLRHSSPALALNLLERDTSDFPLKNALMGHLYMSAGQFENASKSFLRADSGRHITTATELATTYWQSDDEKNATKWLKTALKLDPKNHQARFLQARILEKNGQDEAAAKLYTELADDTALPKSIATQVYTKCAQYDPDPEARIRFYNKILSVQSNSPEALYALGRLYLLEKNDSQRSLGYFEKFVQVAPPSDPKVGELKAMIEQIRTAMANDAGMTVP